MEVILIIFPFSTMFSSPFLLALPRQVLGSSPMPKCLQLVRDLAAEKLGPGPLGAWRNLQLVVKMEDALRKEKGGARRAVKESHGIRGFVGELSGELWGSIWIFSWYLKNVMIHMMLVMEITVVIVHIVWFVVSRCF